MHLINWGIRQACGIDHWVVQNPQPVEVFPLAAALSIQVLWEEVTQHAARAGLGASAFFINLVIQLIIIQMKVIIAFL